ncbi:MAG TPA: LysR family transcriptional regulator [Solirubrobacteraceae bacterium]|jgi:DNA-binding transcriptional LysR family regulator|nr:LysR family transcriptional regulator [Solirubrobacteraceae bacterium]
MELRQLYAFVAVAEEGTFVAAADRLGVVQPAVSQTVGRLERELGFALFQRSSRRVSLTGEGEAFLPHAHAVLARLKQAQRVAEDLAAGRAGIIRLATTGGAWDVTNTLLAEHRAAHPDVHVELQQARRMPKLEAILNGEIDAALVHTAPPTPGLSFTEITCESWQVVASSTHPLAGAGPIALKALADDPLVLVAGDRQGTRRLREQLAALCRGAGFEPRIGPTLESLEDALIEIARSTSWTFLRAANARDAGRVGVAALRVADPLPPARLWLAHQTSPPPATRALAALAHRLCESAVGLDHAR